jgi:hypothetical protein
MDMTKFPNPGGKPKRIRLILITILIPVLIVVFCVSFLILQPRIPQAAMMMYLDLNSTARKLESENYTPRIIQRVHQNWERALQSMQNENHRFSLFRDYTQVEKLILQANQDLQESIHRTRVMQDSLRLAVSLKIMYLQDQLEQYRLKFDMVPVTTDLREHIIKGELLVREGEDLSNRKNYLAASRMLEKASEHISFADSNLSQEINDYLSEVPVWQQWIKEILNYSRTSGKVILIIDKMEHRCRVYQSGKLELEVPIEMGPYWVGAKKQKGDKRTPEGKYFITKKRKSGETKFYKALQLNYPNEDDWLRFYVAKRNGEIAPDTKIGGLIEIHGEGGKGVNWTDGCVAVHNRDMDKVFKITEVGTPVTIVGSTKNYEINSNHSNNHLN